MTDNEIIKALECCASDNINGCDDCPFYKRCENDDNLCKYALDLINRLKAEIERVTAERDNEHRCYLHICEDLKQAVNRNIIAKSKARKEVAEQLEAEIISSDKYIREYDDSEVQKAYNKGLRDALKILKEMGCDNA